MSNKNASSQHPLDQKLVSTALLVYCPKCSVRKAVTNFLAMYCIN